MLQRDVAERFKPEADGTIMPEGPVPQTAKQSIIRQ
jgi:hypothetical protein